ncbi:MAG: SUF system NifU family Fe-S cluster assembly protein [Bacilli bacterium]|nr:SUF system NifU family Fe-S cluster assembly protein [Bacilli bacterium]
MDPIIKRNIILENYQNPEKKGLIDDNSYLKMNTNNESCIDNLDIMYKIENGIITDACFDGEACAISTSATSIMMKKIIGLSIEEAKELIKNYENMLYERPYNENILGELMVYDEIYKQPNRKKCALLPFESLKKVVGYEENNDN